MIAAATWSVVSALVLRRHRGDIGHAIVHTKRRRAHTVHRRRSVWRQASPAYSSLPMRGILGG
jgi:hypothetical protein